MRKFFILALLLAACTAEDCNPNQQVNMLEISPALPIKVYLNGEESYNQKAMCGVNKVCWLQPWKCSDRIALQFRAPIGEFDSMTMKLFDKNDNLVAELPMTKTYGNLVPISTTSLSFLNEDFASGLDDWSQLASGLGEDTPFVASNPGTPQVQAGPVALKNRSQFLYQSREAGWPAGQYGATIRVKNNSPSFVGGAIVYVFGLNGDDYSDLVNITTLSTGGFDDDNAWHDFDIEWNAAIRYDKIGIRAQQVIEGEWVDMSVQYIDITSNPAYDFNKTYFTVEFIPEQLSPAICNTDIRAEFYDQDDNLLAFTDGMEVRNDDNFRNPFATCTNLMEYWNDSDFEGIDYSSFSPQLTFQVRLPSNEFIEDEEILTTEIHKLSNGDIARLMVDMEKKTMLQTDWIPYHVKRQLAYWLMHDNVKLAGKYWVAQDNMEMQKSRKFSLCNVSVLLTEKDFERNTF